MLSDQKEAGQALLGAPGSRAVGMAVKGLGQSALPATAQLKSFEPFRVGTGSDDSNPVSPAQSLAQRNCLLRDRLSGGRAVGGGWSVLASPCAAWRCPPHWVPVAPAQLDPLDPCDHLPAGVMPKRGLDVSTCEIFRFYKLITTKSLIEPISMIVPRRVRVLGVAARGRGPSWKTSPGPLPEAATGQLMSTSLWGRRLQP